jgi:hypothetical protein
MKLLKYILAISICLISIIDYNLPFSLLSYNIKNGLLSEELSKYLFKLLPYVNMIPIILLVLNFNKNSFKFICLAITTFYLFFTIGMIVTQDCPKCAAWGILPLVPYNFQLLIFFILFTLSLFIYFSKDPSIGKNVIKLNG